MALAQTLNANALTQPLEALLGSDVLFQNPEMALLDRIDTMSAEAAPDANVSAQAGGSDGDVAAAVAAMQNGGMGVTSALDLNGLLGLHASGSADSGGALSGVSGLPGLSALTGLLDLGGATGLLAGLGGGTLPTGNLAGDVITLENNAVLDLHLLLEQLGHTLGVPYAVHGVTTTGETVGLGKIGMSNLLTDALSPLAALGLPTPADISPIVNGATSIVTGLGNDLANPFDHLGLLQAVEEGRAIGIQPIVGTIDAVANETATFIQNIGNHVGTPTTATGIDHILGTIGLGNIDSIPGSHNLLTDLVNSTTGIIPGSTPQQSLDHIPTDIANVLGAVTALPNAIAADLSFDHGGFLGSVLGGTPLAGLGATAGGALNGVTGTFGATLTQPIVSAASTVTHALDGVLPQVASTVGSLLDGTGLVTGHTGLGAGLNQGVASVAAPLLHEVGGLLASGTGGGLTGVLGGAAGGTADPLSAVTGLLGGVSGGHTDPLSAVTGLLGGATGGHADPLSAVTGLLGGASGGTADPLSAVTGLLGGASGGHSDPLSAVTSLLGGGSGGHADPLSAVTGLLGASGTAASTSGTDSLVGTLTGVVSNIAAPVSHDATTVATPDPSLDLGHVIASVTHLTTPDSHGLLHL